MKLTKYSPNQVCCHFPIVFSDTGLMYADLARQNFVNGLTTGRIRTTRWLNRVGIRSLVDMAKEVRSRNSSNKGAADSNSTSPINQGEVTRKDGCILLNPVLIKCPDIFPGHLHVARILNFSLLTAFFVVSDPWVEGWR
jgi:hypothetical protein